MNITLLILLYKIVITHTKINSNWCNVGFSFLHNGTTTHGLEEVEISPLISEDLSLPHEPQLPLFCRKQIVCKLIKCDICEICIIAQLIEEF